ncbi:MAG: peroxidase family protein [Pseudomonadota bacterium]
MRGIDRDALAQTPEVRPRPELRVRSIDGSNNSLSNPAIGAAGTALIRLTPPAYADGHSELAGEERPNPRVISNTVAAQHDDQVNAFGKTDYVWQWGQFLDHDLDLTDGTDPPEPANIPVPAGDPWFDPLGTGVVRIPMNRSIHKDSASSREQLNEITAWIDASNVYGSDEKRAEALRTLDGSGELKTSEGGMLPFNVDGLANAGGNSATLFVAGDVRANEQAGLAAMHTLFVREHNRLARIYSARNPGWTGEQVYQQARRMVGAQMQAITYREFLPALLGANALPPYSGYDASIDAGIANEFAHAAYRLGHSMLSSVILRLDENGDEIEAGHLALRDAFFRPSSLTEEGGIAPLLRGLASQPHQRIDPQLVDDVRNLLFVQPSSGGFDLASLNIQRGRDHGFAGYNEVRAALGLRLKESFADISSSPEVVARLASVYDDVDDIDLWVGGLAEDPVADGQVGELFRSILVDQFRRLRDGDRFWYERSLTASELRVIESLRLSDIIRLNTEVGEELQDDVFRVPALSLVR